MKKNTRIALQRSTQTQSSTGQPVDAWTTYATVMGAVKNLRGSAYYAAQQTANEVQVEAYIHYRSDISAADMAIVGSVTYEIAAPPENLGFKNREMLLRLRHVG